MDLEDLDLSTRTTNALVTAGVRTAEQLAAINRREVGAISGVGPASLDEIEAALEARGLALAVDPFAPYVCAREGKLVGDAKLADLWLCDDCADQFEARPFDGTPPEFVSPPMGGHCVNCGRDVPTVKLRQWFLCGVCGRVAESFGKSVVAATELLRRWAQDIEPRIRIDLKDVDFPVLNRRTQEVIAAKKAAIDFEGQDPEDDQAIFGFEMKTGPGGIGRAAVKPMSEFQLDCSDCDDILAVVEARERLPVYLLHAQVVTRAAPPTPKFVPVGYWWTDLYSMAEAFTHVRQRTREARPAAYFDVRMFRPLSDFPDHIESGELDAVARRLRDDGPPRLYEI